MDTTRREFIKKSLLLSGAAGLSTMLPLSIQRALAIDPQPGSTYLDAEHVVILMQENRSFDHCFGTLKGVRGFNDPRIMDLPNGNPVWLQSNDSGSTYAPFRLDIKESRITWMRDLPHGRHDQVDAGNGGKHDQWLESKRPHRQKEYADLPLTMGYYTRQDIPFNYAFADAFTVCDHNFCSANTSTFPNRLYLMSGTLRNPEDASAQAFIRNNVIQRGVEPWETFPEVLEKNDLSWRVYQNDLRTGGGYQGEEQAWLGNYNCNVLEYYDRYNVKFNPRYTRSLKRQLEELPGEIEELKTKIAGLTEDSEAYKKAERAIQAKQTVLDNALKDAEQFTAENFNNLSQEDKNLFNNAFTINKNDPDYDKLTTLSYDDGGEKRLLDVPKGDVLHQFRADVDQGKLPTVSWLVAPARFSDHPSHPWYGAWYVSEILDILTKNPEVWKKTIFILTYDENDGYFDHIPPFIPPSPVTPNSGKTSKEIDIEREFITLEGELEAGVNPKEAREAPIGLGYRVPMIIASPWSRGGKVCSQVFDHTSTLQFLEGFLSKKTGKRIECNNISRWRRAVCGDLTSVFSPYNPDVQDPKLSFLSRDGQIKSIHKAKFKDIPSGFKALAKAEIEQARQGDLSMFMPQQESGVRTACALPYQMQVGGKLRADKKAFEISLRVGNEVFGERSAGAPFKIYAPDNYQDETSQNGFETARIWNYAVVPGDTVSDEWTIDAFESQAYHLRVYGPNGFYRAFRGNVQDPDVVLAMKEERDSRLGKLTGNMVLHIENVHPEKEYTILVHDHAYKTADIQKKIPPKGAGQHKVSVLLNLKKSFGWYDFSVRLTGFDTFEQRYAGHVETGNDTLTDPFMGRVI